MRTSTRTAAIVFVTACCLYLLTCSGRMGSMDAYTQLQASVQLVMTGSVGTTDRGLYDYAGIPSPDGRYFQAHDPGNVVLLLPAAAVAAMAGGDDAARDVPAVGRVASALIYAIVGAACLTAIYLSLRQVLPMRAALTTAVLAGFATPLWIYARCTMDVLPAALGVAGALAVLLAGANDTNASNRTAILAAVAVTFTGWFRMSLLPFLALSAVAALAWGRPNWLRASMVFSATMAIGILPVLYYNDIRTGNPLLLGTMAPQYADQNGLTGSLGMGLYGLTISPNHGLFVFAPWLLLGLLPHGIRSLSRPHRTVVCALALGAVAYTLLIASLQQWAKIEWGPRYVVPILPVLIVPAALAAVELWKGQRGRVVVAALALASFATTLPAAIVNYSYVVTDYPGAADPASPQPRQLMGVYAALGAALNGHDLEGPAAILDDPERLAGLRFPDLLIARLAERGGTSRVAGWTLLVALLLGAGWGVRAAWFDLYRIAGTADTPGVASRPGR